MVEKQCEMEFPLDGLESMEHAEIILEDLIDISYIDYPRNIRPAGGSEEHQLIQTMIDDLRTNGSEYNFRVEVSIAKNNEV